MSSLFNNITFCPHFSASLFSYVKISILYFTGKKSLW